jgi:hypothetical protein
MNGYGGKRKKAVKTGGAKAKRRIQRRAWTKEDQRELRAHSRAKAAVTAISREMERSVRALRQQALKLGISLGQKAAGRKAKRRIQRRAWTKEDQRELRAHSRAKTPVTAISREMKRSVGALRQQALKLGISLGARR